MKIKLGKVLVVGGAGFVGSNLVERLLSEEVDQIFIVDNLLSSNVSNVPKSDKVKFIYGSVSSDTILNKLPDDISFVFHLSCFHGNQSSIHDPIADHENNTFTTLKLLQHLTHQKALKKVVYAAAGCAVAEKTFDRAEATHEDAPVSLYHDSPYSISKLIGEMYCNYYWKQFNLPTVKARFQNVYGPREILGAGDWRGTMHSVWRNVIPTFIWKAINGESLPLDNGGKASRDFIFVRDMANGLLACALKGEPGQNYNLASGVETSILNLAKTINSIAGNEAPLDIKPARAWDRSGCRFGSTEKSEKHLKFKAQVQLEEGLKETIGWTLKNREIIESSVNRHAYFLQNN